MMRSGRTLVAPPKLKQIAATFTLLMALLAIFGFAVPVPRQLLFDGMVSHSDQISIVAQHGGQLESLLVFQGADVRSGDHLATLRLATSMSHGESSVSMREALALELSALEDTYRAEARDLAFEVAELSLELNQIRNDVYFLAESIRLQSELVNSSKAVVAELEPVAEKGFVSNSYLNDRRNVSLEQQTRLISLRREKSTLEWRERQILDSLRRTEGKLEGSKARHERDRAALLQRQLTSYPEDKYDLVAPADGKIVAVFGVPGGHHDIGDAVLVLEEARTSARLVEFQATGSNISKLSEGQSATVEFTDRGRTFLRKAFPAEIVRVDRAPFPQDRSSAASERYRIFVSLNDPPANLLGGTPVIVRVTYESEPFLASLVRQT